MSPDTSPDPRRDYLPRPRLEIVLRSAKLLASRMACGSLSGKGSKSLWRHEGREVTSGEESVCPFPGPTALKGRTPAIRLRGSAQTGDFSGVEGQCPEAEGASGSIQVPAPGTQRCWGQLHGKWGFMALAGLSWPGEAQEASTEGTILGRVSNPLPPAPGPHRNALSCAGSFSPPC